METHRIMPPNDEVPQKPNLNEEIESVEEEFVSDNEGEDGSVEEDANEESDDEEDDDGTEDVNEKQVEGLKDCSITEPQSSTRTSLATQTSYKKDASTQTDDAAMDIGTQCDFSDDDDDGGSESDEHDESELGESDGVEFEDDYENVCQLVQNDDDE